MVMDPLRKDVKRISKALEPSFKVVDILSPPVSRRIHEQRTGIRRLDEVIDLYARHEAQLEKLAELHLTKLRIRREGMVRRLAEMTRLGR